jgi:hypothetical protein
MKSWRYEWQHLVHENPKICLAYPQARECKNQWQARMHMYRQYNTIPYTKNPQQALSVKQIRHMKSGSTTEYILSLLKGSYPDWQIV